MAAPKRFIRKNKKLPTKRAVVHKKVEKKEEEKVHPVQQPDIIALPQSLAAKPQTPAPKTPAQPQTPEITATPSEPAQSVTTDSPVPVAPETPSAEQPQPIETPLLSTTPDASLPGTAASEPLPPGASNPPLQGMTMTEDHPIVSDSKPENTSSEKQINKFMVIGVCLLFVLVSAVVGYLMYQLGFRKGQDEAMRNISSTVVPTVAVPSVTPSPEITVAPSRYTISLMNGSGIAGEATRAKILLESQSYNVGTVGNADRTDYNQTIIQAKKSVDGGWIKQLRMTLEKRYSLSDVDTMAASESSDVVVIIGSKKTTTQ